jgi:hypothetical protein
MGASCLPPEKHQLSTVFAQISPIPVENRSSFIDYSCQNRHFLIGFSDNSAQAIGEMQLPVRPCLHLNAEKSQQL